MKPTCERVIGHAPTEWGSRPITCKRSLGLTTWRDEFGNEHRACHSHLEALLYRWPATMWAPGELSEAFGR